jgi:hypothetical protein
MHKKQIFVVKLIEKVYKIIKVGAAKKKLKRVVSKHLISL